MDACKCINALLSLLNISKVEKDQVITVEKTETCCESELKL